ncbi:MAG: glycosyltransferase family 39 protein, partial [Desulfobacterales bacterium]|nr:glycosyltransferase family 39 protein [Desulfobacterales bacterium]
MNDTIANRNNRLQIRPDLLISLFLVMAILAVYLQVRNHDFINFDDDLYVTINPHVQAGLTLDSITWAFTSTRASNWHPLTWLSHMLDCQIYGMNPGQHHLTNVLFHILNTLLLFFVFMRMTKDLWQSGFVAALFALHPLHVESVVWLAERKDVLSTFFWMLTLWSYVRYVERSGLNRYLPVLFFFILGLMAKPMLVTLPFVLLLLDYWPLERFRLGPSEDGQDCLPGRLYLGLVLEKIPLFLLSAGSSVITFM